MKTDTASRTFVGSVVCVDLVGYSKRSITQQSEIKNAFVRLITQALKGVALEDRIILDTGDGAAISFLGDPEACLSVAIKLRDTMNAAGDKLGAEPGQGPVRMGINMGPVKLAVDMNGHPNIIGDGISVAERIAAFANPGQLVVSRSFYDMVSRISDDHAKLFRYEGMRTDRNVREHEIYVVEAPPEPPPKPAPPPKAAAPAPAPAVDAPPRPSAIVSFLRDTVKVSIAAVVLLVVIAIEGAILADRSPAATSTAAVTPPPAASAVPAPKPEAAPAPPVIAKPEEKKAALPPAVETKPLKAPEPRPAPPPVVSKPEEKKAVLPEPKPAPPPIAATPEEKKAALPESKPAPPPVAAKPAEPKPEPKPAPPPEPKAAKPTPPEPKAAKPPERKVDEPPRVVIPPPRPPPAQVAPPPQTAPAVPQTEPAPVIREEPKPAPPPAPVVATHATPISRAPVSFPLAAVNRGIERGSVRARLTINAAGGVTDVNILSSDPPRVFDREAVRSLESWKFNPGTDKRTYEIEIEFKR